ncbi:MAG: serine/threonine protein kinase [Actinomycetota bacterium]
MRMNAGDHLDHFEIVEPLGEGAYAETYKARDTRTGQLVLLKSPNPLLFADPAIHQRFVRESEIASHLDHPGVQRGIDPGKSRSEPYLALEFIEGDTLRRWLRAHQGKLSIDQAVTWAIELAEALAYLHSHKIVHRDLKPENIIVTNAQQLKIIDFGTALLEGARRLTWRHLTEALGTPDYMSPEQIQGERGDQRSDVYALGIMLYEFLTGHVPFEGDNYLAVMAGHLQRHPKSIREQRPEVSPELEAVVLTAMRRYPENRYQTAEELLVDLRALPHTAVAQAPPAAPSTGHVGQPPAGAAAPQPGAAARHPEAGGPSPGAAGPSPGAPLPLPRPPGPALGSPLTIGTPPAASQPAAPSSPSVAARSSSPPTAGRPAVPSFGSSRPAPSSPSGGASGAGSGRSLPSPLPTAGGRVPATQRDLSPEKPIGRLPAPQSKGALWGFVGMLAGGFILIVALIIFLSVALRH